MSRSNSHMLRLVLLGTVAVALILAVSTVESPVAAQDSITVTDLGTLGGGYSYALSVNNLGQVVGYSETSSGFDHAFLWEDGVMTDLGTFGGDDSYAYDINDLGQVVGGADTADGYRHAFLWTAEDGMIDLGTLPDASSSYANGVNNLGQVVGDSWPHAFLWTVDGGMIDLGTLVGGTWSHANDINDAGQVVGSRKTASNQVHAFLWENGEMTDLGTLGGTWTDAWRINDLGQVAGWSETADGTDHAFLWENGEMTDLGTLEGTMWSYAMGINDWGQVVGASGSGGPSGFWYAVLWEGGVMTDLRSLGGKWDSAENINNLGLVAGTSETADGVLHATLWTVPIPVVTPDEAIAEVMETVAVLVADGTLHNGEGIALTSKLEAAQAQFDKGNPTPAANVLGAFINQVEAMTNSERLTADEAQPLIDSANDAIELIEAEP